MADIRKTFGDLYDRARGSIGEDVLQGIIRQSRDMILGDIGTGQFDTVEGFSKMFSEKGGKISVNLNPADGNTRRFFQSVQENVLREETQVNAQRRQKALAEQQKIFELELADQARQRVEFNASKGANIVSTVLRQGQASAGLLSTNKNETLG